MNEQSRYFLTIAIPTYNRAGSLLRTVEAAIAQIPDRHEHDIEIVISDNCSVDDTERRISDLVAGISPANIRYFRNDRNIGFDRNCDALVRKARGKYVWLMSDDDSLEDSAITQVYDALKANDGVVFAFVNYSTYVGPVRHESGCSMTGTEKVAGEELPLRTRFAFSFVSSCIFSRTRWVERDWSTHHGSGWIHLFAARDLLLTGEALIIGRPLIRMTGVDLLTSRAEKQSEKRAIEFYVEVHLKFVDFAKSLEASGYPAEISRQAVDIAWRSNLRQIVYYKITARTYDAGELARILNAMRVHFGHRWQFWLLQVPVLFAPNLLIRTGYNLSKPGYLAIKNLLRRIRAGHA